MATLFHHWLSPASRYVRIVLAEKGIDAELRLEKDWERREAFLRLNPAGEVPVFIDDEGDVFADCLAIAEYLEDRQATPALRGDDIKTRHEVRRLVGWFMVRMDREVSRHLIDEKLMKRFLAMGGVDSEVIRCAAHNIRIHLAYINWLAERRHYLAGKHFTLADAAAAAHISVADYFGDITWSDWPEAKDWYARVKSRKSVRGLLEDRIAGLVPPAHYDKLDY